jgi:phenylacetate-coenzyme A ligase PaaK-like adenylate-forming protein
MSTGLARRFDAVKSIGAGKQLARLFEAATREDLDAIQAQRLRALVAHAREYSPFYATRLRGIDLDAPDLLRRLPTLNKASMIENLPAILTDARLREVDLAAHVDGLAGDELLLDEYRVMASGGTSGVRGFYVYDRKAWVEVAAGMGAVAFLLGLPPRLPRVRAATIWAAGSAHMSARIAMSFRSPAYTRLSLSAMAAASELVAALNDFRPDWLSGYPSVVALLAEEQIAGHLQISPRVVMTTSEQCTPGMRSRIAAAWGTEPFNTYSATEAGGMALECDHHGGMHIFESQVALEIVDDDARPVPDGEPGARVLVTNLYNQTQPLIRFELTDMVTLAAEPCPCGRPSRRITAIDGRSDDIMRLTDERGNDVPVHPNHFAEAVESVAAVSAYQVIEVADGVAITIVASEGATETVAARVRANLEPLGVAHTPIRVDQVERIARPSGASGKFKLVHAKLREPANR